jgi:hypothetical protein
VTRSLPPEPTDGARLLHVRCLRPGCGHDAVLKPREVFGEGAWPADGLSHRFRCLCGGRVAHVSYVLRRPKGDNPCGWL